MKLASFDLEIAKAVEGDDWQTQRLGISCAAVMLPEMNVSGAAGLVRNLAGLAADGYTLVTVNGAGFDFAVLAEESGMVAECADLMLNHHCDLMMMSVCRLPWGWVGYLL